MKQNNQEKYKLVGTINVYGLVPGFTEPIFERDGKHYFQGRSTERTIEYFEEITKEELIKKIHFLTEKDKLKNIKDKYCIGDKAIAAFQLNDKENFVSSIPEFLKFINSILINNPNINNNLKKDIEDFFEEVCQSKTENTKKR